MYYYISPYGILKQKNVRLYIILVKNVNTFKYFYRRPIMAEAENKKPNKIKEVAKDLIPSTTAGKVIGGIITAGISVGSFLLGRKTNKPKKN